MKPCNRCGKNITMKEVSEGWRPFNPDGSRHLCLNKSTTANTSSPTPAHQPSVTNHPPPFTKPKKQASHFRDTQQYETKKKFGSFSGEHVFTFHVYRMYKVQVQASNAKEAKKQLEEQELPEPDFQHLYNAEVVAEDIKTDSIQPVFN